MHVKLTKYFFKVQKFTAIIYLQSQVTKTFLGSGKLTHLYTYELSALCKFIYYRLLHEVRQMNYLELVILIYESQT